MANKPNPKTAAKGEAPLDALAQLQEAGFGNMAGMSTVWMEAMSELGAEMVSFVADRIKEDVKTQHDILQCKNVAELQHVQAQFIQKAMDQYQDETGKLTEMSAKAFAPKSDE